MAVVHIESGWIPATSNLGWSGSLTTNNSIPSDVWYSHFRPIYRPPSQPEWPLVAPSLERARRNIVLVRARAGYAPVRSPPRRYDTPTVLAPRRVVVPRGVVSWVRAGTRRPL